jgi:hypothetical protein
MQASLHVEPSTRKWTFAGKKTLHPSIKKLEYEEIKSGEFLRTGCLPPDVKIGSCKTRYHDGFFTASFSLESPLAFSGEFITSSQEEQQQ